MVKRDLAGRAPARFDALKLAESGGTLTGEIDPAQLPRLIDLLAPAVDAAGARIAWRIIGGRDALGHPALTLALDGTVFLLCQRCLRPFAVPVAQQTELLLARNEPELSRLDAEEPEVVLAGAPLDPVTLVEDELLLSLPFSPRHTKDQCVAAAPAVAAPQAVPSAFAQLAGLKPGRRSRN
jgi:DUF177 domain-containing protein